VRNRIGVIRHGFAADGSRQLILPSGEIAEVSGDVTDAGLVERFGLDVVRHADAPRWCQGVCRDGPMTGEVVYAADRIGSNVVIALPPRPGGAVVEYEVTRVSTDARLAELRLCKDWTLAIGAVPRHKRRTSPAWPPVWARNAVDEPAAIITGTTVVITAAVILRDVRLACKTRDAMIYHRIAAAMAP